MSRQILFLDDDPDRHRKIAKALPGATHVHTAAEAIEQLRTKRWDVVMLDYDLDQFGGEDTGNGEDVVHWALDHAARFRQGTLFVVHSHNWMFGPVMAEKLKNAGIVTVRYRAAETDPFFLRKLDVGDIEQIMAAVTDPDNLTVPTRTL